MDVSIIIVNYNTEKLILDCLDSIYEKTEGLEFEVIVVDNDSPNKPDILKNDKRIRYIQSETNFGFGKANNLGAEYAKGEYLFCLNPDTLLINNAIKELYDFIKSHPECGICGSNLYHEDMTPGHSYEILEPGIFYEFVNSRSFTSKRFNEDFNTSETPKKVLHVVGASLMIKKELFDNIGGFDKDFFMFLEETYLCHEVKNRGYDIYNIPSSKIIHLEGKSIKLRKYHEDLCADGRKKYIIKRYGVTYFVISNIIYSLNSLINIIYFLIKGKSEERKIWTYRFLKLIKLYY